MTYHATQGDEQDNPGQDGDAAGENEDEAMPIPKAWIIRGKGPRIRGGDLGPW